MILFKLYHTFQLVNGEKISFRQQPQMKNMNKNTFALYKKKKEKYFNDNEFMNFSAVEKINIILRNNWISWDLLKARG